MADTEKESPFGFVNKQKTQGAATGGLGTPTNYASVNSLRTRLAALGYTSARLDNMTRNDMVYALRLADDPTTF